MENQKKSAVVGFSVILLAVSTILLPASPCAAQFLEVPLPSGETTLNVDYPIYESVTVKAGGTLNLLDGGSINGEFGIGIEEGGKLNIMGGHINRDVYIARDSEVNIKGGSIGGNIFGWDITVEAQAKVTVFGTHFSVACGTIDPSGTYFTPDAGYRCLLTGNYGGDAGEIDLLFYVFSDDVHIFLAPPALEVIIDIKPGSNQNNINLNSKGIIPVAVLTADGFYADTINPDTAIFAGAAPEHWSFEDVDDDGDIDVIFHFRTQELALDQNSTQATLTAQLLTQEGISGIQKEISEAQEEISGTDEVHVVKPKK